MVLILFVQVLKKVLKSLKFELKYPGGTLVRLLHVRISSKVSVFLFAHVFFTLLESMVTLYNKYTVIK